LQPAGDRPSGNRHHAATTLGGVYHRLGRHRSALEQHHTALQLAGETDSRYIRARALAGIASAQLGLGQHRPALATIGQALATIRDNGYQALQVEALTTLAEIRAAASRHEQAVAAAREAIRIGEATGGGV
jgi:tetratricopeptide (TPR) repeat protein